MPIGFLFCHLGHKKFFFAISYLRDPLGIGIFFKLFMKTLLKSKPHRIPLQPLNTPHTS